MTTDGAWAGHQVVTSTWEGTLPLKHWLYQLKAPVLLGGQGPPHVGSWSRDQEEWMMWLEYALRSDCQSWSCDLSSGALLHSGTGWMESRAWTPILGLLGGEGEGRETPALHTGFAEQPPAHSLITLSSDLLNSGKPCSGWLWSHFVPLEGLRMKESEVSQLCPALCDPMDCSPPGPLGLRWLHIRHLIVQVNPEPPYYCLWATKQIAVAHTCGLSMSLGSGMGFCVTPSTLGK